MSHTSPIPSHHSQEQLHRIYALGMQALDLVREGNRPGLLENIRQARLLGVQIEDTAFDSLLARREKEQ